MSSNSHIIVDSNPHCACVGKSAYGSLCEYGCKGLNRKCGRFMDHTLYWTDKDGNKYHGFYDFTLDPCVDGTYPLVCWKVPT